MRRLSLTAALVIVVPAGLSAAPPEKASVSQPSSPGTKIVAKDAADQKKIAEAPRIDLALLLDTSNSMDGLINQARAQLWKVVNDLATAEKNGKTPKLRVALYEYGNDSLPSEGGHIRRVLPFTDDLDRVSEELFALTTNGGQEYCGQVIEAAASGLDWSKSDEDLKLIVIAGNEPFAQGPVEYKHACSEAIAKGIVVNTIFCGRREEGLSTGWADGAKLADGTYSNIDQNQQIAEIRTPFDDELARLSGAVNKTYIFFGRGRERLMQNQAAQDANAAGLGGAIAAERAAAKAGTAYQFEADIVNLATKDEEALNKIKEEELPAELKDKSEAERKSYLKEMAAERAKIEKQIKELAEKRKSYIAEERKKLAASDKELSLDEALLGSLREQAAKKDFSFKK